MQSILEMLKKSTTQEKDDIQREQMLSICQVLC